MHLPPCYFQVIAGKIEAGENSVTFYFHLLDKFNTIVLFTFKTNQLNKITSLMGYNTKKWYFRKLTINTYHTDNIIIRHYCLIIPHWHVTLYRYRNIDTFFRMLRFLANLLNIILAVTNMISKVLSLSLWY